MAAIAEVQRDPLRTPLIATTGLTIVASVAMAAPSVLRHYNVITKPAVGILLLGTAIPVLCTILSTALLCDTDEDPDDQDGITDEQVAAFRQLRGQVMLELMGVDLGPLAGMRLSQLRRELPVALARGDFNGRSAEHLAAIRRAIDILYPQQTAQPPATEAK
jgi:hypothetical protein